MICLVNKEVKTVKKERKRTLPRVLGLVLSLCMIGTLLVTPAFAASDRETVYEQFENVSATYRGETKSYPSKTGYVFAGWYDGDQGKPLTEAQADAASSAYAKFVDKDVFTVKYQLPAGDTALSETTSLRMVTTVDDLNYSKVGFVITIGEKSVPVTSKNVYRTITWFYNGNQYAEPAMFSAASNYFMAFTLNGISNSVFSQDINIAATWTTMDGTVVTAAEEDERDVVIGDVLPDLFAGVGFEDPMDSGVVTQRTGITSTDTISIVTYEGESVTPAPNGGANALWIDNSDLEKEADNYWTHFRINFGAAVPEGTKVSFYVYGYDSSGEGTNPPQLFFAAPGSVGGDRNQVGIVSNGEWKEISFTLSNQKTVDGEGRYADLGYVDLFYWNGYDDDNMAGLSEDEANWSSFLIDNVTLTEPYDYDITAETIDFETKGMEEAVKGVDSSFASSQRVSYAQEGISKPENGGNYLVKLSANANQWPNFQLYFGKTLAVGTEIVFDGYLTGTSRTDVSMNYSSAFKGSRNEWEPEGTWKGHGSGVWETYTVVIGVQESYVQLYLNDDNAGENLAFYIDNLRIKPVPYTLDITQGVDFETSGMEAAVTAISGDWRTVDSVERLTYADAGISSNGGNYVLKLTKTNCSWPSLRLNFGKALAAGTTIQFDAYTVVGNWNGGNHNFEFTGAGSGNATDWFADETWTTCQLTVPAAFDGAGYVDMFFGTNSSTENVGTHVIYIDNIRVKEAEYVLDVTAGTIDFETSGMEAAVTAISGDWRTVDSVERLTYADAGISSNGGNYVLKLTKTNCSWPSLRLNFGKALAAGTTIQFDAYTVVGNWNGGNHNFEFTGAGSGNATDWFADETWTTCQLTVPAAFDGAGYVDMFFGTNSSTENVGTHVIYIDNIRISN